MDNEQFERWLRALDDDMKEVQRIVGAGSWTEGERTLVTKLERVEERITHLEYGAQNRTILIYVSIVLGIANLLAVSGLYLQ